MSVQSGNSLTSQSFRFPIEDISHTGAARRQAAVLAGELKFNESEKGRVGIIVNELCSNLINHARGGEIILRPLPDSGFTPALEILSIDRGQGIEDIHRALQDGYSTTSTPGTGLGAIRRQASDFDIYSQPGKGSVVMATICTGTSPEKTKPTWQWAAINLPIKGEEKSGDAWSFSLNESKTVLAVVDGLGHGVLAHEASMQALEVFHFHHQTKNLEELIPLIHGALRSTRGAAVSLMALDFNARKISFAGVGNVRGLTAKGEQTKTLLTYPGTMGLNAPKAKVIYQDWDENTLFAMHSDGITSRWDFSPYPGLLSRHPSLICSIIYRDFNRNSDDVTIVVGGLQ